MLNTKLTFFNTAVGLTALSVQVFLLYPWHEDLDKEFKKLKAEHSAEIARLKSHKEDSNDRIHAKLDEIMTKLESTQKRTE
ncbi:hypothetical protein BC940DRAFT_123167 [Gongronella butleri]|nr:hypothetical protein BC940DRAFT_123167 [Gongronella butleri]